MIKIILYSITLCFLISCNSTEEADLEKYIKETKKKPAPPLTPLPKLDLIPKFSFPETERRNPFKPLPVSTSDEEAPNTDRPKEPLERYPLDALKYVGLLKQGAVIWGLVKEPSGLITRVKMGNYMGNNFGVVKRITEKEIEIIETIQVNGKWEKRSMTLKIAVPKEGERVA